MVTLPWFCLALLFQNGFVWRGSRASWLVRRCFTKFADVRYCAFIAFDLQTLLPPCSAQYGTAIMFSGAVQNIQEEAVVLLSYSTGT